MKKRKPVKCEKKSKAPRKKEMSASKKLMTFVEASDPKDWDPAKYGKRQAKAVKTSGGKSQDNLRATDSSGKRYLEYKITFGGDLWHYAKLDPQTPEELEAERLRIQREVARQGAMTRLWKSACKQVNLRYPDPRVSVHQKAIGQNTWGVWKFQVQIILSNLRDTSNQDHVIKTFYMLGTPKSWPGLECAKIYIAGLWALYLMHESMELCTETDYGFGPPYTYTYSFGQREYIKKYIEKPIVDAHDVNGFHQQYIAQKTEDIGSVMDWLLGLGEGQKMLDKHAERARLDMENELEPWEPGT